MFDFIRARSVSYSMEQYLNEADQHPERFVP
jgi:hypothetical protein